MALSLSIKAKNFVIWGIKIINGTNLIEKERWQAICKRWGDSKGDKIEDHIRARKNWMWKKNWKTWAWIRYHCQFPRQRFETNQICIIRWSSAGYLWKHWGIRKLKEVSGMAWKFE